ncbi:hypothetical protein [Mycolicibacterium llatzerense]|nr:hypothetical protein [Mycolicibacterium llatzerense]
MPAPAADLVEDEPSPIKGIEPVDADWAIVRVDDGSGNYVEYEVRVGAPA